jgi:hypothetical protein
LRGLEDELHFKSGVHCGGVVYLKKNSFNNKGVIMENLGLYRSASSLKSGVVGLSIALIVFTAISALLTFISFMAFNESGGTKVKVITDNLEMQGGLGMFTGIISLVSIILYLCWFWKSYNNLYAFGIEKLRYTPQFAIGSYFIPIVNFWAPYQSMKELWLGSLPQPTGASDEAAFGDPDANSAKIVGLWWFFVLLNAFFSIISWILSRNMKPDNYSAFALVGILGSIASVFAIIYVIKLVKRITAAQEAKAKTGIEKLYYSKI